MTWWWNSTVKEEEPKEEEPKEEKPKEEPKEELCVYHGDAGFNKAEGEVLCLLGVKGRFDDFMMWYSKKPDNFYHFPNIKNQDGKYQAIVIAHEHIRKIVLTKLDDRIVEMQDVDIQEEKQILTEEKEVL